MLSYPSTVALSTRTLNHLADLIRAHRNALGSGGVGSTPTSRRCWSWRIYATATPTPDWPEGSPSA
jgi:hypothetical protein